MNLMQPGLPVAAVRDAAHNSHTTNYEQRPERPPGEGQVLTTGNLLRVITLLALAGVQHTLAAVAETPASSPQDIIGASCSGCHAKNGDGQWFRISEQRKTPEGWQMTLARMQFAHQAQIIDPAGGDSDAAMHTLVKYFADTQGLAPQESADYRYVLERELNTIEQHETEQFRSMCARCHTGARVKLQRRTEDEWRNLVHFHLGQFPTTEYQMMGRDRDWWGIAINDVLPELAADYPLQTEEWQQWQAAEKPQLAGKWLVTGYMPGRGDFYGEMVSTAKENDQYGLEFTGQFAEGEPLTGAGNAIVYTGYEWRAALRLGDVSYQQVMAASPDGTELTGRMFQRDHDERGLRLRAVMDSGKGQVLAVQPGYMQAGTEGLLNIVGSNLEGKIDLGPGVKVLETVAQDDSHIQVRAVVEEGAAAGAREVKVGKATLPDAVIVFDQIDRLEVEPAFAVGRVGGNGGSQPVVEAIFDAVAWSAGADGESGTEDDLRIGPVAAQWSVAPYNEQAVRDQDVRFAGEMDKDSGVFTPAAAGPNPERKYQTNNAGNLKVIAALDTEQETLQGEGQLIVTVQRWNNPPIR